MDYHKELKKKMSASYERQVKQWMASDPAQLIAAAEDIAAIRFIHENLVDTISDEDASFLLTLDDPLWDVSSKWVEENGSDMVHDDDIHHCTAGYPQTKRSSSPVTRPKSNTTRKKSTPIQIGRWSDFMRMRASLVPRLKSERLFSR